MNFNISCFINYIGLLNKKTGASLLFFVGAMITVRYPSFSQLVIGHDESTYLEIAREWFQGKMLYKDLIDIKPVGIYGIFGFLQIIGVKSVFGLRLVSSVFLGLGAFSLNRLTYHWSKNSLASLVTALAFIFLHSYFVSFTINTEAYFTLFILFGITLGVTGIDEENKLKLFFGGLLIGLAFIIKYLALMEGLAFGLIMLITLKKDKFKSIAIYIIGGAIPFIAVNIFFWLSGGWDYFYFITYTAPFNYINGNNVNYIDIIRPMARFFLPFLIITPLLFKVNKKTLQSIFIWLTFSFIAILLPKKTFPHYWIQLFAPIALLFGFSFSAFKNNTNKLILFPIVILLVFIKFNFHKTNSYFKRKDSVREVVEYLHTVIKPSESIFCANFEQIIYYELKKDSPTPYVHKSILYNESHQHTLNIDGKQELTKIINQQPTYITIRDKYPIEWFQEYVNSNYLLLKKIGSISIFKNRKNK